MTAPDGKIRIPLKEEASKGTGQIEEFLMEFNGEGIKHIALRTENMIESVDKLRAGVVELMPAPPETYYEMMEERLSGQGEPVGELKARGILLDGNTENGPRLLRQIFSATLLRPVFSSLFSERGCRIRRGEF